MGFQRWQHHSSDSLYEWVRLVVLVVVLAEAILGKSGCNGWASYDPRWVVEMAVVPGYDDEALDTAEYVPGEDLLALFATLV